MNLSASYLPKNEALVNDDTINDNNTNTILTMLKTVIKNTNFFTNTSSPHGVEVHVYIPDKDASEHFFD